MEDESELRGAAGREEVGGREDWSSEVRRKDRRRELSPAVEIDGRADVEAPSARGRDVLGPEPDEEEGNAIPLADSAGEDGRGMLEIDPDGTGRYVGVCGRDGIAVRVDDDRLVPILDDDLLDGRETG